MKTYKVIAKFKNLKNERIQPFFIAKIYKSLKRANTFIEGQQNNPRFYFTIETV